MDVTPRELREIDFRTEWKGYHRDDVDDLLERAAATIESQNERVRQATERADAAQVQAAQAAQAAQAQGGPPERETEDMLRRTLVLAQRTADEAVAEAQVEARRITEEADSHARRVVSEAEANARRVAEGERQRLEAEVLDLGARREALLADVEQLERFANDYRARLRSAIERDLDTLATRPPVVDSPRPQLHEVDIPAANAPGSAPPLAVAPTPSVTPHAAPAPAPPPSPTVPAANHRPDRPPAAAVPALPADAPPVVASPAPSPVAPAEPERTIELDKVPPPAPAPARDEPLEAEVLDDDAFFASLREAVRDDSPLGPRPDDQATLDGDDDASRFGNVFKRRR